MGGDVVCVLNWLGEVNNNIQLNLAMLNHQQSILIMGGTVIAQF